MKLAEIFICKKKTPSCWMLMGCLGMKFTFYYFIGDEMKVLCVSTESNKQN